MKNVSFVLKFFWEIIKISLVVLVLVFLMWQFFLFPFRVEGNSMFPTLLAGQYIIVEKVTYHKRDPEVGDVVVFRSIENPKVFFVKRIVGLPGDLVRIEDGLVTRSARGESFELGDEFGKTPGTMEILLDGNEYFVLGDNRVESSDSRVWGPVPESYIIGKVFPRILPRKPTLF